MALDIVKEKKRDVVIEKEIHTLITDLHYYFLALIGKLSKG